MKAFRLIVLAGSVFAVAALTSAESLAESIADQIDGIEKGRVSITFESRDGVCGDGRGSVSFGRHGHTHLHLGNNSIHISDDDDWWDEDCVEGPVHVMLRVRDGEVMRLKTRVGGGWSSSDDVTDLGMVEPRDAVDFLLDLARNAHSGVAEDAILPALLARDVVVWPELIEIARDRSVARDARKSAVFWLGALAGDKATEGLAELVDDDDMELEVRKSAVFALSQQDNSDSVEQLVTIARTNRHPQIRRSALFWLAQSDDPRVLDIFEDILTDAN